MDFTSTSVPETSQPAKQGGPLPQQVDHANATRVETQTVRATHNAVKAEDLSIFVGARCLLASAELKIAEQPQIVPPDTLAAGAKASKKGTCYGLVGFNGCGKSTLLRLIAEGRLPVPPTWNVFLVSQHLAAPQEHCAVDEVMTADRYRTQLLQERASLEGQVETISGNCLEAFEAANARLQEVNHELSRWDDAEKEVTDILLGLGFRRPERHDVACSEPTIATPMNVLSGGWRMKVQLAKALWLQPKLLLLDEPTNHLDFQAIKWLEDKLEQYPHTSVVVSHDVSFLHGVCKEILWMRDLRIETLPRDMVSQEDLLRMQRRRALNFNFTTPESDNAEDHGLSLHGVEFKYEEGNASSSGPRRLHVKKEIRFSGRSRSVLLGRNGTGKSTFLNLCAGNLCPTSGHVDRTPDLRIGYYSQLTDELDQNSTDSAASYLVRECREELAGHAGSTRGARLRSSLASRAQKGDSKHKDMDARAPTVAQAAAQQKRLLEIARGVLSNFGFDGDAAVNVPVDRLSGGQKALLKFAVLSLRPSHILLLDEPTNHLDAEACEALAKGLSEFKGGIVAVTHDELLIYRLIHCNWSASELIVCRGGSVWREGNFGAHCLNALKNEMHRVEETEAPIGNTQLHSQEVQLTSHLGNATVTSKNEIPPWLQSKRRVSKKRDQTRDVASELVEVEKAPEMSAARSQKPYASMLHRIPLQEKAVLPEKHAITLTRPVMNASIPETSPQKTIELPATWEEAVESDATTDIPEDETVAEESDAIAAPDKHEQSGNRCPEIEPPPRHCQDELPGSVDQEPTQWDRSNEINSGAENKHGRHSRFRKDIVNLNKAVKKWLRQKEKGEIANHQVAERIKTSIVAQHLQALHSDQFDVDRFVRDALQHAGQK